MPNDGHQNRQRCQALLAVNDLRRRLMLLLDEYDTTQEVRILCRHRLFVSGACGPDIVEQLLGFLCGPGIRPLVPCNKEPEPVPEDVLQVILFTDNLNGTHDVPDVVLRHLKSGRVASPSSTRRNPHNPPDKGQPSMFMLVGQ